MPLASATRDLSLCAESAAAEPFAQPSKFNAPVSPVRLGRWQLEAVIAEGRWSRVYRAVRSGRNGAASDGAARYAIKALYEHAAPNKAAKFDDHRQLALSRLRTEATVGRCIMHPHVAPILSAHVHEAPYYVVMPLLNGASAAAMLKARGRLQTSQALWIARQIAEGLEALHTLGYVHGDVRPANVFVGHDGHATLIDLGCARRVDANLHTGDAPLIGSIESLAPEQHLGHSATLRSDLYGLGLTMFQLLTGRLPWRSADVGVIAAWKTSSQHADVREFAPGVPAAVARFVRLLMAVEPLRRPTSAREVAEELVRLEIATIGSRVRAS